MYTEDDTEEDKALDKAEELERVRQKRNILLQESDLYVFKKYENGELIDSDLRTYRQKLRSITEDFENPYEVVWPVDPISGD